MKSTKTKKRNQGSLKNLKKYLRLRKYWLGATVVLAGFIFSWWIMWHTFSLQSGIIRVACKAWSDFAAHLPLIRSFSWGDNFPPQYPLFPNQPIRYHFLFYAFVGQLEKIGMTLDWALNLPSIISFFFLIVAIYLFSRQLFKNKWVSLLAVIFFLFNASFSFYYFFANNQTFSFEIIEKIVTNRDFHAFAPYDDSLVSGGFWNLNVFTNQRHFASAISLLLILILWTLKNIQKKSFNFKKSLVVGLLIGGLPFLHGAVFVTAIIVFGGIFLLFGSRKNMALSLITALILFAPQYWYLNSGAGGTSIRFEPGYLVHDNFNLYVLVRYWFLNLGLNFFLIPAGFLTADRPAKKVFLVFLPVFFAGNLFQFGPDIAANHKFFNIWLIVGAMFTARLLLLIWKKGIINKALVLVTIFFLTLSGVIDLFAIKNDQICQVGSSQINQDVAWIKNNTPPDATFLNTSYLYHPASLAGRKIFLGWPYFSWSAGYNTHQRDQKRKQILEAKENDRQSTCQQLAENQISYLALGKNDPADLAPNYSFINNNFTMVYHNPQTNLQIFDIQKSCYDQ